MTPQQAEALNAKMIDKIKQLKPEMADEQIISFLGSNCHTTVDPAVNKAILWVDGNYADSFEL